MKLNEIPVLKLTRAMMIHYSQILSQNKYFGRFYDAQKRSALWLKNSKQNNV